jgi:hypothetical protein
VDGLEVSLRSLIHKLTGPTNFIVGCWPWR